MSEGIEFGRRTRGETFKQKPAEQELTDEQLLGKCRAFAQTMRNPGGNKEMTAALQEFEAFEKNRAIDPVFADTIVRDRMMRNIRMLYNRLTTGRK